MAPAPKAAPAPKTQSPSPDSSSPPPSDYSSPPSDFSSPPSPSSKPPPPPSESPPPSPPKSQKRRSPSKNNKDFSSPTSPLSPRKPPSSETSTLGPSNVRRSRGSAPNKSPSGSTGKLHKASNRKSPSKSTDSDSISNSATNSSITIIIGIAAAVLVFLALVIVCLLCNRRKKKPYYINHSHEKPPGLSGGGTYYNDKPDHVVKLGGSWGQPPPYNNSNGSLRPRISAESPQIMPLSLSKNQFLFDELTAATGGFTQYNLLGQGGFGNVHKGVLPNGQEVAVKSLKAGSGQGEREFQAEVEIISRVHHRNLVSLVGYCISDDERMLVYEYVPNKTLEFHLHGKGQVVMDWETRMRIALGSAKGLAYLHEDCHPRIIHRDIKSANILLDHEYEAKVADFGLAKLTSANDTHVSTRVMGTFGYLAPEYASSGKLSDKSDVYSFGVMLLEMLTGRKPVNPTTDDMDESLVDWARPLVTKAMEDGDYNEFVDPRLKGNYDRDEIARMTSCASAAVRHSARRRPKMSQIVRALEGNASLDSLAEKTGGETSSYDTRAYNNDMMKFKKMVMPSGEFSGASTSTSTNDETGSSDAERQ